MTQARIYSIEALEELKAALARFGADAQKALDAAAVETRRTFDRLEERLKHWQAELRRREEAVTRAKSDLSQSRWMREDRTGGTEQQIALAKAKQRLREAEEKIQLIRRWLQQLPKAIAEYETPARSFAGFLESSLQQGLALLEKKLAALEEYAALTAQPPLSTEKQP